MAVAEKWLPFFIQDASLRLPWSMYHRPIAVWVWQYADHDQITLDNLEINSYFDDS
jgi:hypothetical protein